MICDWVTTVLRAPSKQSHTLVQNIRELLNQRVWVSGVCLSLSLWALIAGLPKLTRCAPPLPPGAPQTIHRGLERHSSKGASTPLPGFEFYSNSITKAAIYYLPLTDEETGSERWDKSQCLPIFLAS